MLKNLPAELTDFCETATHENFAYSLFVFFEKFTDRDPLHSNFALRLPAASKSHRGSAENDEVNYADYLKFVGR